jgi:hypothetical protein
MAALAIEAASSQRSAEIKPKARRLRNAHTSAALSMVFIFLSFLFFYRIRKGSAGNRFGSNSRV